MVQLIKGQDWFRWHDSGDIQSFKHLDNIFEVCKRTPETKHWMPTREAQFLKVISPASVPPNLIIRMSSHMIDQGPVKFWPWTSTVTSGSGRSCPAPEQGNSCGSCRQSQHCLQLPQLLPCSGAGQLLPSPLVTVDVHGQNLTGPWSIMCELILIIKFDGIVAGSNCFKNCASRVGIQCRVWLVRLHTSNIFSKCFILWMSPESCHLNQSWPLMSCTIASTHCGCSKAARRRCSACWTLLNLYRPFRA